MQDLFVTVTGINHYYGLTPFEAGRVVILTKEPENEYDAEAIRAELPLIGKIGYVANSPHTVIQGTMSAGRVYDKMDNACFAQVMFAKDGFIIVKLEKELKELITAVKIEGGKTLYEPSNMRREIELWPNLQAKS